MLARAVRKAVISDEFNKARGLPERSKRVRLAFDGEVWNAEREVDLDAVVAELLLVGVDEWESARESIDEVTEAVSEELDSSRVVILTPRPSLLQGSVNTIILRL